MLDNGSKEKQGKKTWVEKLSKCINLKREKERNVVEEELD